LREYSGSHVSTLDIGSGREACRRLTVYVVSLTSWVVVLSILQDRERVAGRDCDLCSVRVREIGTGAPPPPKA
jgi:hypothetical protein